MGNKSFRDHNVDYKRYVGGKYDYAGGLQFACLIKVGLWPNHKFLDFGCGSLRGGRFFINYLKPDNYYGIEPNERILKEGIEGNLLVELIKIKRPKFNFNEDCNLAIFNIKFDFILAQSIFSHMAVSQIRTALKSAYEAMHKDTIFVATFKRGDKNFEGTEFQYPGLTRYTLEFMNDLVRESSLNLKILKFPHQTTQTWMLIEK